MYTALESFPVFSFVDKSLMSDHVWPKHGLVRYIVRCLWPCIYVSHQTRSVDMLLWSFNGKLKSLLDRSGYWTCDLWFASPMLYQLSSEVKSVQVGNISELSLVPSISVCFYNLEFLFLWWFNSHHSQANFSACSVGPDTLRPCLHGTRRTWGQAEFILFRLFTHKFVLLGCIKRKAKKDKFLPGSKFLQCRVNGVSEATSQTRLHLSDNIRNKKFQSCYSFLLSSLSQLASSLYHVTILFVILSE
jgi:hypothetical protein